MANLRTAVSADEAQIRALIGELENAEPDSTLFSIIFSQNMDNPDVNYYVYENNNTIIGFVSIHIQYLLHHSAKIAEIQELVVAESHRHRGVGSMLFQKAVDISHDLGCAQLEVCCNQRRLPSHEFYLSKGMTNNHYKFCLRLDD